MPHHRIICGKSETELKQFDDDSFDSCVTDPPYGLEFMGKDWDKFGISESRGAYLSSTRKKDCDYKLKGEGRYSDMTLKEKNTFQQFTYQWATELYRVMKPGAHILVFGGDRTEHRMKCAVEDAGFDIRGTIVYCYGSGFPKSLDIGKSFDKMAGVEREEYGNPLKEKQTSSHGKTIALNAKNGVGTITPIPVSEEAIQWDGWGTGLKPAVELICMARKPISERNIASNVLKWGVGGINIESCRICLNGGTKSKGKGVESEICYGNGLNKTGVEPINKGRFPANLCLECCCEDDELVEGKAENNARIRKDIENKQYKVSAYGKKGTGNGWVSQNNEKCLIHTNPNCACRMLDEQSGETKSTDSIRHNNQSDISGKKGIYGKFNNKDTQGFSDNGGASRFFYQAKASQNERWFYCTICKQAYPMKERDKHIHNAPEETKYQFLEFHPTQKPEELICYLMRLITPPNGTTIDPFLGSGTAIIAAEREGFNCVGIDSKPEYCEMGYVRGKAELVQQKISGEQSTIERIGF